MKTKSSLKCVLHLKVETKHVIWLIRIILFWGVLFTGLFSLSSSLSLSLSLVPLCFFLNSKSKIPLLILFTWIAYCSSLFDTRCVYMKPQNRTMKLRTMLLCVQQGRWRTEGSGEEEMRGLDGSNALH